MTNWIPGSWAEVLVGTPIAGTVEQINAVGAFVRDIGTDAWSYQLMVQQAQREMGGLVGAAVSRIGAKVTDTLVPGSTALMRSSDEAKRAFDTYAAEVDRIHRDTMALCDSVDDRLTSIRSQADSIQAIVSEIRVAASYPWDEGAPGQMPEPRLGSDADDLTGSQRAAAVQNLKVLYEHRWFSAAMNWHADIDEVSIAKRSWANLIEERKQAERRLTAALDGTTMGQLITLASGSDRSRQSLVAFAFAGELRGSAEGAPRPSAAHPLLRKLLGAESGEHIWDSPPDPVLLAASWAALTDAERALLVQEVPWVIGNLPGLPYQVRDRANRLMLEYYAVHRDLLGADSRVAVDQLMKIIAEGERVQPPVQVVALDLSGQVPMTAVGYGELDTANNLTWQVPGMESDAHNALETWDEASRNLYREQHSLSALAGAGTVGVIVFLSYDTPDLSDSLRGNGVLSSRLARDGAVRLAAELDGAHWTRTHALGAVPASVAAPPRIAVMAHSYGTTVVANALTIVKHEVASFSMAGSAGLDAGTVTSLRQLNVAETAPGQQAIYASHAGEDRLAPLGLVLGRRANPNANFQYEHAQNYSGAFYYSSDGLTAETGEAFAPTDGHSVIGQKSTQWFHLDRHIRHGLGFEATEGHGYWDLETQSLRNLAATSLGLPQEVVGGLHVPAD